MRFLIQNKNSIFFKYYGGLGNFIFFYSLLFSYTAHAFESDLYGSLRLQGEYVMPDNESENFNNYTALRDAYSRIGLKLVHSLTDKCFCAF